MFDIRCQRCYYNKVKKVLPMTVHLISKLCYEITALVSQAKGRLFFCGLTAMGTNRIAKTK